MRSGQPLSALLIYAVLSVTAFAQQPTTATTEDGRKVLLYPDGTWRLSLATPTPAPDGTPVDSGSAKSFQKPGAASLFVKAAKGEFGVWINPDKWKQDNPATPDPIKIVFNHKNGDGYAMVISERISIPTDALKNIAVSNAKDSAPDIHVLLEEKRVVNGKQILCLKMAGTIQGIPFIYYGYYYGGPEGTLQVVTYTSASLFNEYKADFEDFLNGTQIGQ